MVLRAIIVGALVAALIVPVIVAEFRRYRPRRVLRAPAVRSAKREPAAKPPLRLVVNKNDMDRELAALLARNSRKPGPSDE
jgi:hypothetical protein